MTTGTLRPETSAGARLTRRRASPLRRRLRRGSAGGPPRRLTARAEALLVTAVLAALTLAFFAPVLTGSTFSVVPFHQGSSFPWAAQPYPADHAFPQTDQADLSHPWQAYVRQTLHDGAFPFWEQHSFGGGYPFFANGQSAVLYPPRLVTAWFLDPALAHDVFSMLHVFLAGIATYLLMKEFTVGLGGALLAAVAWMFAGFNMAWLHLEVVTPMAVFLPLDILCIHRAFRTGSWKWTALAGLALAMTLLSGHLILLGIVYMTAVAYAAALAGVRVLREVRSGRCRSCVEHLARLGALVVLPLGVAAFVLVPTYLVLSDSMRVPFSYHDLTKGGWGPNDEIPLLASPRTFLYTFWPPPLPPTGERMHEMAFVGTLAACLAVVGAFVRRPGAWFGRVLFLVAFAVAVGGPATWLAYHLVPGFDVFRPYSRLVVLSSFAAAVLAGLGLDAVWRWSRHVSSPKAGAGLRTERMAVPAVVAVVSLLAIAGTSLQLIDYGREVNPPFAPRRAELTFPATPLTRAMQRELHRPGQWPGRILPLSVVHAGGGSGGRVLFAAQALVVPVDSTAGYDSVIPRRVVDVTRVLNGESPQAVLDKGYPSAFAPTFRSTSTRFYLLDRLGITAIAATPARRPGLEDWGPHGQALETETLYSGPDGRLLGVVGARAGPRLRFADEVVPSEEDALRRFVSEDFEHERSVVVERSELRRTGTERLGEHTGAGRVISATRGVNSARIVVDTDAPAWLLVPDSWSSGWSARVDGEDAAVLRANYVQRAVRVPAGRSEVTMRYRPAGFRVGLAVTALSLLAGVAMLAPGSRLVAIARRRVAEKPGAGVRRR